MQRFLNYFLTITIFLLHSQSIAANLQGFFLDDWEPKQITNPDFVNHQKPSENPTVTITVDFSDTLTKISEYIYGNNANTYSTIMHDNPQLVENIIDLNPHVIRYPGGNLSNEFFWDCNKNDRPDDMPADVGFWAGKNSEQWTMCVDNYYKFLDAVGSTGIITLNYAYARYGLSAKPVEKAAQYAADWVRYDDGRTKFWEIGNENFGSWQAGYEIDTSANQDGQPKKINGELYGQHSLIFIDSMRAAAAEIGHEIYIGLQAYEEETSYDLVQTGWNECMMPIVGDVADFYIVHNYYTPYNENSTAQTILNSYTKSHDFKSQVLRDLEDAGFGPAPITLTEWNIFAVGSKQQVSHINGMHAVLVLGKLIEDGYGLAARWDLANGWANGDDHGMFSQGNEPGVTRFTPRPVFYYMTYFQKYFGDVMVGLKVSGSQDIIAFASSFQSGQSGIVIINKNTDEKVIEVKVDDYKYNERYFWYTLVGGEMDGEFSRQVLVNGEGPDIVAGGPADYKSIKAYSAIIEGGIKIAAPPYSVNYLLVDGQNSVTPVTTDDFAQTIDDFQITQNYPNPFNPSTKIIYSIPQSDFVVLKIYNLRGQEIQTLVTKFQEAGNYTVNFEANHLPSDIYFYQLKTGKFSEIKKMILLR